MVIWLNDGCVMVGVLVGGGSNYAVFTCFFEFFRLFCPQYCTMCFNITVSAIIIGCCVNGTRFVGRNAVHWSRLKHPKCNMTAVDDIVIDNGSGGGTEWWIIIILVFFLLLSLVSGLLGVWANRRRRRREVGRSGEAVEEDSV